MATAIPVHNPRTGEADTAFQGFSWTSLFFGAFPALFRRDFFGAVIGFGLALITFGFSWLVWPFLYNGWHRNGLTKKGFVPLTSTTAPSEPAAASTAPTS